MNRTAFIVMSVLSLMVFSACQSEITNRQQEASNNSSTNSNINDSTRETMLMREPTPTDPTIRTSPPQIFIISDADVERAFADGERLYQDIRRPGGNPPKFGVEKRLTFAYLSKRN